jgi:hypothetical protein
MDAIGILLQELLESDSQKKTESTMPLLMKHVNWGNYVFFGNYLRKTPLLGERGEWLEAQGLIGTFILTLRGLRRRGFGR